MKLMLDDDDNDDDGDDEMLLFSIRIKHCQIYICCLVRASM
jgi:hypothetical protein